jgi:hypothetical protein
MDNEMTDETIPSMPAGWLRDVERLALQPGDVVVLHVPTVLSIEERHAFHQHCQKFFPGHRSLVLDGGIHVAAACGEDRLERIEQKIDKLFALIEAADEEEIVTDLEGHTSGRPREPDTPL